MTATFDAASEASQIPAVLRSFDGALKSISFMAMTEGIYAQAPYERVSLDRWKNLWENVSPMDWDRLYDGEALEAEGEKYCTTDSCQL